MQQMRVNAPLDLKAKVTVVVHNSLGWHRPGPWVGRHAPQDG
jgi:hypothetical protein